MFIIKENQIWLRQILNFSLCVVLFAGTTNAATLNVPSDHNTIQAAIDAASASDTISIQPGTYSENLTINKNIVLRGTETARTLLNGSNNNPGIDIVGPDASNITLRNLTFISGEPGININNVSSVDIVNNVFQLGGRGIAIDIDDDTPNVEIINNTFVDHDTAIRSSSELLTIQNNIFSNNTSTLSSSVGTGGMTIDYNCYANGDDIIGSNSIEGNINFVNPSKRDFHLQTGSVCIDEGTGIDDIDDTTADMGAYGGNSADPIPFPAQNGQASDASAPPVYNIQLSWSANNAYLTDGYRVHYGSEQSGVYNGTDADNGNSPINVGNVTSYTLNNLTAATNTPDTPVLNSPAPSNERLTLNWSTVSSASGYRIYYGLASTSENTINVGDTTTYTLEGLDNGEVYQVQVSALKQARYYLAITVLDSEGNESAYSDEVTLTLGSELESSLSNLQTAIPEEVVPYPAVPDQGEGHCFIATSAFERGNTPEVTILRRFRDQHLLHNPIGRWFVAQYYQRSPEMAAWLDNHTALKPLVRLLLTPVVWLAISLTYVTPLQLGLLTLLPVLLLLLKPYSIRQRNSI